MIIFLIIVAMVGVIIAPQLVEAFWANPFINIVILGALAIGIVLAFLQVARLFPEVRWVNSLQSGNMDATAKQPTMLLPVAVILRDRLGETMITPASLRSILDSVGNRLDESKDTARYLTGLLVFLGLLGTFYGLLQTVSSVGDVIQSLDITAGDSGNLFSNLKEGLEAPLSGMGTAFASSLFGLSGSLILGFLDLQTSQAQNAFYTDLEDWMSSMTELDHPMTQIQADQMGVDGASMQEMVAQLGATMQNSTSSQNAIRAMAELAHGLDGLTKLIRQQQDDLRTHITDQAANNQKMRELVDALLNSVENDANDGGKSGKGK
jgi:hypothetical protein